MVDPMQTSSGKIAGAFSNAMEGLSNIKSNLQERLTGSKTSEGTRSPSWAPKKNAVNVTGTSISKTDTPSKRTSVERIVSSTLSQAGKIFTKDTSKKEGLKEDARHGTFIEKLANTIKDLQNDTHVEVSERDSIIKKHTAGLTREERKFDIDFISHMETKTDAVNLLREQLVLSDKEYASEFPQTAGAEKEINSFFNNAVTAREIATLFKEAENTPVQELRETPLYSKVFSGLAQNLEKAPGTLAIATYLDAAGGPTGDLISQKHQSAGKYKELQQMLQSDLISHVATSNLLEENYNIEHLSKFAKNLPPNERKNLLTAINSRPMYERTATADYVKSVLILLDQGTASEEELEKSERKLELLKKMYDPNVENLSSADKATVIETIQITLEKSTFENIPRESKGYLEKQLEKLQSLS